MKKIFLILTIGSILSAGILDTIENKVESIKNTPISAELYAKNSSDVCSLVIKNISAPKSENSGLIDKINVEPRKYFREIKKGLKLGKYEFEYSWYKNGKLIDSSLKTKVLMPIHNINNKISKKWDLTFLVFRPKECK